MRNLIWIFNFAIICTTLNSQTSLKKSIRLDDALATVIHGCNIQDDNLLVVGFNFKGDSSYNFCAILDTNLNVLQLENLHDDFGYISSGTRTTYTFTSDGGSLVAIYPPQDDTTAYTLIKYDGELNKEWVLEPPSKFSRFNVKYIETDTSYFIFGETSSYEIDVDVDLVHQLFVDEISKSGDFLSHRTLFEKAAFMNLGDAIIVDDKFVVSYSFSETFSTSPKFARTSRVVNYDNEFKILNVWEDISYDENLNYINDSYYLSSWYIDNPDLVQNEPHHIVRKISSDFELEWTKEYLYPLFKEDPNVLGADNIIRRMWPDLRGGLYIVGDLVGPDNAFLENPPMYPGGDLKRGTSLIKINEDGEQQWVYKDNFDFINPMAAATLSSGNIIIVGEGLILDENGIQRETITAIKLDKDGCHEPGCREDVSILDEKQDQINIAPNPSNGLFDLSCENLNINKITIVNSSGKEIYTIENPDPHFEIDISKYPSGIYIATFINSKNEILTKKLVKR